MSSAQFISNSAPIPSVPVRIHIHQVPLFSHFVWHAFDMRVTSRSQDIFLPTVHILLIVFCMRIQGGGGGTRPAQMYCKSLNKQIVTLLHIWFVSYMWIFRSYFYFLQKYQFSFESTKIPLNGFRWSRFRKNWTYV